MRKLSDAQVKTLMHIAISEPSMPTNPDRFPTVRMLLENNIIENRGGRLCLNSKSPENAYQYVVPDDFLDDSVFLGFDELEKSGLLVFNPSADFYRETPENDNDYRSRLVSAIPAGHVHTAEDIGNASGEALNAIGNSYKCYRIPADTFFYYDLAILVQELRALGAEVNVSNNEITASGSMESIGQAKALTDAFDAKYMAPTIFSPASKLTPEALNRLRASKNHNEWNAVCDEIKSPNGELPSDWFDKVLVSGIAAEAQRNWKMN